MEKLGSPERLERRKHQRKFTEKVKKCVQKQVATVEARAQNALQELQAQTKVLEQKVQKTEQKNHNLQTQIKSSTCLPNNTS